MKKLAISLLVLAGASIYAQNHFTLGTYIGIPLMDTNKSASVNIGAQFSYLRGLSSDFKLGTSLGYSHYFIKALGTDIGIYPLAAKAQFTIPRTQFFLDADVGYGFANSSSFENGFYAFPKVGYKLEKSEFYLGFQSFSSRYKFGVVNETGTVHNIAERFSVGSLNLGYTFYFR